LNYTNHLDHFVPLCDLLDATLFVYSKEDEAVLNTFYPKTKYRLLLQDESMFQTLAEEADILIASTAETGSYFQMRIEEVTGKKIPSIFLPHGQSDKAYAASRMVTHAQHRFVYGPYMRQQIIDQGVSVQTMFTLGNFRLAYYQKHVDFFSTLLPNSFRKKKQTILYAPTWNDHEQSSSIQEGFPLIDTLAKEYNLIIKLHPLTFRDQPGYYYAMEEKAKQHTNIWFASDIPCVYPILSISDFYIGDYSSIGYDYLVFNRPLIFLKPKDALKCERGNTLHSCGTIVNDGSKILDILKNGDNYQENRQNLYSYAFGEKDPEIVKKIAKLRRP